jgi:Na+-driven multidrug efflux pump
MRQLVCAPQLSSVLTVPAAWILAYFTNSGIQVMFAVVTFVECAKCFVGLILVSKVNWAKKIT